MMEKREGRWGQELFWFSKRTKTTSNSEQILQKKEEKVNPKIAVLRRNVLGNTYFIDSV